MRQTPSQAPAFCGAPATRGHSIPGAARAGELISRTVPPKTRTTRTSAAPKTTIWHSAHPQAAPIHAATQTQAAVAMYLTTFVISDNNACPQETDPGHDALGSSIDLGPSSSVLELKPNKSESLSVGARHRLHPLLSGTPNS